METDKNRLFIDEAFHLCERNLPRSSQGGGESANADDCCCCPFARSHPRHRVHAHGRFASPITARPRRMAAPRRALPLRRSRAAHSSCRLRPRAACPSCGCSRGRRFLRCEMAPRPTRVPRRPFRPRSTSTLHFLAAAIHMGRALPSFRSASSWFWHASVSVAGLPAAVVAVAARAAPAALGARRVCEVRAGAECGCGCGRICACVSSFLRASCGLTCAELKTGARAASIGAAVGAAGSNASAC